MRWRATFLPVAKTRLAKHSGAKRAGKKRTGLLVIF